MKILAIFRKSVLSIIFVVGVVLSIEILVPIMKIPEYLLPVPTSVVALLAKKWEIIAFHWTLTSYEALVGLLIASLGGILLAIAVTFSRVLRAIVYPAMISTQVIPKIALAPLLLLWLGYGTQSKLAISALLAFFPITISTIHGLSSVRQDIIDLSRSLKASAWMTFVKIRFPHSLPYTLSAMKIAAVLSVSGAVVGEFVGGSEGLGFLITYSAHLGETQLLFSAVFFLMVLGTIMFGIIGILERVFVKWRFITRE